MEFEDPRAEWQKIFDQMDEHERFWAEMLKVKVAFAWKTVKNIANAVVAFMYQKVERPDLFFEMKLEPDVLRHRIVTNEEINRYAMELFDDLYDYICEFRDCDFPKGRKLLYKKIEYRFYSEDKIREGIAAFEKNCQSLTPEQHVVLCESFRDDAITDDYYAKYEKLIHDELKKLAVEYFPEIGDIRPNGIREIDFHLYINMIWIREEIYKIIE